MSTYINRGGEQVYLPPFTADGTRLFAFAVRANRQALQENICDRYLNTPIGNHSKRFIPALEQVFFVFNTIDSLQASSTDWIDRGRFAETEAAVWMLVADRQTHRLHWFHPYMLVDNAYALCMGREIYGFPKTLGWFTLPSQMGPDAPAQLQVDTLGVKTFGPTAKGQRYPLFEVRKIESSDNTTPKMVTAIEEAGDLMGELVQLSQINGDWFSTLGLAAHALDDLLHWRLPMVFLKEFREGSHPENSCYHAVQTVDVTLTRFHGACIYTDAYELHITDLDSHPIRQDLGLPNGPIAVEYGFWTHFDFTIGACNAVLEAQR